MTRGSVPGETCSFHGRKNCGKCRCGLCKKGHIIEGFSGPDHCSRDRDPVDPCPWYSTKKPTRKELLRLEARRLSVAVFQARLDLANTAMAWWNDQDTTCQELLLACVNVNELQEALTAVENKLAPR